MSKRERDRQTEKEREKSRTERGRENEKEKTNVLGTYYATKWNETSHPKSVNVYLLSHQTIPAIQSNNDIIPTGHPQHTIKPHFHSVSISIVIFHTAHRAMGSSRLVVHSKQYRISV